MKLFSFPQVVLEKAVAKRMLGLAPEDRAWFSAHWMQKPYKKSFVQTKAMPLITLLAKGKNWNDEEFAQGLADWDVTFYPAEAAVLRPMVEGDGLIQLMQKNMPAERIDALLEKIDTHQHAQTN